METQTIPTAQECYSSLPERVERISDYAAYILEKNLKTRYTSLPERARLSTEERYILARSRELLEHSYNQKVFQAKWRAERLAKYFANSNEGKK